MSMFTVQSTLYNAHVIVNIEKYITSHILCIMNYSSTLIVSSQIQTSFCNIIIYVIAIIFSSQGFVKPTI